MATFTNLSKTTQSEMDFLFSDSSDFLFSDGSDYVFVESAGSPITNLSANISVMKPYVKGGAGWSNLAKA